MKRIVIIATAAIALLFAGWGFYKTKNTILSGKTDIYTAFPEEPICVLRINNLVEFSNSLLYNNNYWHDISAMDDFASANTVLTQLDSLKEVDGDLRKIITERTFNIAFFCDSTYNTQTLICAQISKKDWEIIKPILEQKISLPYFAEYQNEILVISSDKNIVLNSVANIKSGESPFAEECSFFSIQKTASKKAPANWIVNSDKALRIVNKWIGEDDALAAILNGYTGYLAFDIEAGEDNIAGNGFVDNSLSSNLLHIFKGQNTGTNTLVNAMSYNTFFFRHLSIDNLELYRRNLIDYYISNDSTIDYNENIHNLEISSGENPLSFFQEFFKEEIVAARNPMGRYIIVRLNNGSEADDKLHKYASAFSSSETKKTASHDIIHLGKNGFVSSVFGDIFALNDEFLVIDDDNLIVASNPNLANYIATRNPQTQTLQCSPIFKQANNSLLTAANQTIYYDLPYMVRNADIFINSDKTDKINKYKKILSNIESIGLQTQAESEKLDYQHIYVQYAKKIEETYSEIITHDDNVISEVVDSTSNINQTTEDNIDNSSNSTKNSLHKLFSAKTDDIINTEPQLLTNHYTGETEILVQDRKNQIYLFSNSGKQIWKAQISEPILGNVYQVDMLKNKKLQIAFITKSKFYIIDRNGKCLTGFPKNLPVGASGPLAVFDYDSNRTYRFVYPTINKTITVMKDDGKIPSDYKSPVFEDCILSAPQFFKLGTKDFIVVNDGKKLYFLDRKGNKRFDTAQKITQSYRNQCFSDGKTLQSHIIACSNDGTIFHIHRDGTIVTLANEEYDNNCAHSFLDMGSNTRHIILDSKKLGIYDKDMKQIMLNTNIGGGKNPTIKANDNTIAINNTKAGEIMIFDGIKASHIASLPFTGNIFTLGRIKPNKESALIVVNGTELSSYLVE